MSMYKDRGVYCIRNTKTSKKYIGCTSMNFGDRRDCHFASLRNGYHYNKEMQSDFDKYGEDSFVFEIIEKIDSDDESIYEEREKYWIQKLDTFNNGYNGTVGGIGLLGTTPSKEKIKSISEINRKRMLGTKLDDATRKSMSEARERNRDRYINGRSILSEKDVYDIKIALMNHERVRDIADKYRVTTRCISKINVGENWKSICPDGWEEYLKTRLL